MFLELYVEHNLLHVHALHITCDSIRSKRPCSLHNLLKTLTRDSNMAYNPLRESTRSGTWISRKIKSILTTYSSAYSWNKFLGKTFRLRAAPPFRRIPSRKWNKKYQGEKNLCQRAVHNAGSEPHGKVTSLPEFRTKPFFFFFSLITWTRTTDFAEKSACSWSSSFQIQIARHDIYMQHD